MVCWGNVGEKDSYFFCQVPMVYNITQEYFMKHHAYSGIPVLVKGGAKHWSSLQLFDFKYFKKASCKLIWIFNQLYSFYRNMRSLEQL